MKTGFNKRRPVGPYNHNHVFDEDLNCIGPLCQIFYWTMRAKGWVACPSDAQGSRKSGKHKAKQNVEGSFEAGG